MAAIQVFMLDCGFSVLSFFHGVFSTFLSLPKFFLFLLKSEYVFQNQSDIF